MKHTKEQNENVFLLGVAKCMFALLVSLAIVTMTIDSGRHMPHSICFNCCIVFALVANENINQCFAVTVDWPIKCTFHARAAILHTWNCVCVWNFVGALFNLKWLNFQELFGQLSQLFNNVNSSQTKLDFALSTKKWAFYATIFHATVEIYVDFSWFVNRSILNATYNTRSHVNSFWK